MDVWFQVSTELMELLCNLSAAAASNELNQWNEPIVWQEETKWHY
jgi:hypothetical protein